MAKENSFSITKITMTPATARNFCIVGAIVLTLVLAIGAVCWTEEGGSMFGNRTSGSSSSSSAMDIADIDLDDAATVVDDPGEVPEGYADVTAEESVDAGADAAGTTADTQPADPDPR